MAPLPQPDDLTSLVLRIDFTDETAWSDLQAAIADRSDTRDATFVSDPPTQAWRSGRSST
jgi:hypothetical protein